MVLSILLIKVVSYINSSSWCLTLWINILTILLEFFIFECFLLHFSLKICLLTLSTIIHERSFYLRFNLILNFFDQHPSFFFLFNDLRHFFVLDNIIENLIQLKVIEHIFKAFLPVLLWHLNHCGASKWIWVSIY
jgi:hypothetical protein